MLLLVMSRANIKRFISPSRILLVVIPSFSSPAAPPCHLSSLPLSSPCHMLFIISLLPFLSLFPSPLILSTNNHSTFRRN